MCKGGWGKVRGTVGWIHKEAVGARDRRAGPRRRSYREVGLGGVSRAACWRRTQITGARPCSAQPAYSIVLHSGIGRKSVGCEFFEPCLDQLCLNLFIAMGRRRLGSEFVGEATWGGTAGGWTRCRRWCRMTRSLSPCGSCDLPPSNSYAPTPIAQPCSGSLTILQLTCWVKNIRILIDMLG